MKFYLPSQRDSPLVTDRQVLIDKLRQFNPQVPFVDGPAPADVILIVEQYSYKTWRHEKTLGQCPLLRRYAEKVVVLNNDDAARSFLPGLYTSLRAGKFDRQVHVACAYPETLHPEIESCVPDGGPAPVAPLATFRGMLRNSALRRRIHDRWKDDPRFRFTIVDRPLGHHSVDERHGFIGDIRDSKFVLCPRGWAPATYRLFETMALGRCPVVLSDDWVPIEGIDWTSCSIRVPENEVSRLAAILQEHESEAAELGRRARQVWEQCFRESARFPAYVRMAAELMQRKPPADFDTLARRWHTRAFRLQHGWTWLQRLAQRWARLRAPT